MRRQRRILLATAVLAVGVPASTAWWVRVRTDALAERLGAAGGLPVTIGRVDADLTGSIRLTDVAFGGLVSAEAIEASVALGTLLGGELRADEIRVEAPKLAIEIDARGDSDLARLARRLALRGGSTGATAGRVRRIVVDRGSLSARVAGVGTLTAEGVELIPDAGGVRIVTGPVRVRTHAAATLPVDLAFARAAAEVALPQLTFRRVLAVGGGGAAGSLDVRDVAVGRLAPTAPLELRGAIDDGGTPRPIALDVAPGDGTITLRGERVPLGAFARHVPRGLGLDRARGSGSITIRRGPDRLEVTADARIDGAVVEHATIAPLPLPVAFAVAGTLAITRDAISVVDAAFSTGALRLTGSGWVRRTAPITGLAEVALAEAPCADLLRSLPAELRGPLDGLALEGRVGGGARLALDLAAPPGQGATLAVSGRGGCRAVAEPPAADAGALLAAFEHQFPDGSRAKLGPDEPGWVPLRRLPDHVGAAFVSAEDGRFWVHRGFDLEQIARSVEVDLRERRLARGGSTISQQLVKNAFLSHRRSIDRKLQEAVLTWRLEERLGKKQILERYLNLIELAPHVFGIGAAARHWFDVAPADLTVRQAAFLAALTSQPTAMSRRVRKAGGLDPESAERVSVILRAMRRDGAISEAEYDDAKSASLHFADER